MIFPLSACYVVAALYASKAMADVCRTNLLVDDFAMFSDRLNSVGLKAGGRSTHSPASALFTYEMSLT